MKRNSIVNFCCIYVNYLGLVVLFLQKGFTAMNYIMDDLKLINKLCIAAKKSMNLNKFVRGRQFVPKKTVFEFPDEFISYAKFCKKVNPLLYRTTVKSTLKDLSDFKEFYNDKGVTYTIKRLLKSGLIKIAYRLQNSKYSGESELLPNLVEHFEKFVK